MCNDNVLHLALEILFASLILHNLLATIPNGRLIVVNLKLNSFNSHPRKVKKYRGDFDARTEASSRNGTWYHFFYIYATALLLIN